MAVTQISRIQHRRGLQQDLPQLASAELGWSVDQRKLYIGNGTLEEGAPTVGITEILTEYSDFTKLAGTYTYAGEAAGYTVLTGDSILNPVTRSYQQKFDDFASVRDFGALGDGITDDTAAINRALQQIYNKTYSVSNPAARRTIYFPAGTYFTSNTIFIPPYARLVGDGVSSSIIKSIIGNQTVANVSDSLFQSGPSIGASSAVLPTDIEIYGLTFQNSNAAPTSPVFVIDSASNIKVQNSGFIGNLSSGHYANVIHISGSTAPSNRITFDNCKILSGGNGISITSSTISSIRIINGTFDNIANTAINTGGSKGVVSLNNYYGNVSLSVTRSGNDDYYSFGDNFYNNQSTNAGLYLGNLQLSTSRQYTVDPTIPTVIPLITNQSITIDYAISIGSSLRTGVFTYTSTGSSTLFKDDYIETAVSVNANLFANSDSLICSVSSSFASLQFSFKQYT
jgi:hypothetical protein